MKEVQAMAALGHAVYFVSSFSTAFARKVIISVPCLSTGPHENIVRYFTSWFENGQLYIQMELCDRCLSMNRNQPLKRGEALELLYQV